MKINYTLSKCSKKDIELILNQHHYLSKISITFKSGFNLSLLHKNKIVGACIFTGFPVPELAYGCFGLNRKEQGGHRG